MDKARQRLARTAHFLRWSVLGAIVLIGISSCIQMEDWLGSGLRYSNSTIYKLSVLNGALMLYSWTAFWTGTWILSQRRWWQSIVIGTLVVFALWASGVALYDSLTEDLWKWAD